MYKQRTQWEYVIHKCEVDAVGVITISRGVLSAAAAIIPPPPTPSYLSFVTLQNRRPTG